MPREVWQLNEASIWIYEINSAGIIQFPAQREAVLARDVTMKVLRFTSEYREPGVAYEQTRSRVIGHEIVIGELHRSKASEISPFIANDGKLWRVRIAFENPAYLGTAEPNDEHDYRYCEVIDGPSLEMRDNELTDCNITFRARWKA